MKLRVLASLSCTGILLALMAVPVTPQPAQSRVSGVGTLPVVSKADAPARTETLDVHWVNVAAPGVGVMLAAIARPSGAGPFPTIILLHGSHGFGREYVQLAQYLAHGGLLVVAACWFSGGGGLGSRFITSISCPDAPSMPGPASLSALQTVTALVQATRALPDARRDRVGLIAHSRGGGAALNYVLKASDVQAVVLDSTGYPKELADVVSEIKIPILMLHGEEDSAADGGSALTNSQMARNFESALRRAGKSVDAKYYAGAGHSGIFASAAQRDDEVQRMVAFFHRHLGN
jgi:carboxymethylenebutenolidase